jgi:hypothetical protein
MAPFDGFVDSVSTPDEGEVIPSTECEIRLGNLGVTLESHLVRYSIFLQGENPGLQAGRESDNSDTYPVLTLIRIFKWYRFVIWRTPRRSHRPVKCTISGLQGPECSRHPLEPLWCLGQDNSESPAGIGVTAVWPRHRPVMSTGRQPAKIPTQRCGADVGSLAVYGEEEVTRWLRTRGPSPPYRVLSGY